MRKRVLVDAPLGLGDADRAASRWPSRRRGAAQLGVRLDGLDDLLADAHHRVQAGPGSWKIMPMRPPRTRASPTGQREQVLAIEAAARGDARFSGSRRISASAVMLLPQPGFADQGEGPAALQMAHAGVRWPSTRPASESSSTRNVGDPAWTASSAIRRGVRLMPRDEAGRQRARAGRRHRARRRRTGSPPAPARP